MNSRGISDRPRVGWLLIIASALTTAGLLAGIAMQWIQHAPFPPSVSISTYGLGPNGWVFTLAMTSVGFATIPLLLAIHRQWPPIPRLVWPLMLTWVVCVLIVGWIRTSAPGQIVDGWVIVHRSAAVVGMIAFPVAVALLTVSRLRRRECTPLEAVLTLLLVTASEISLILVAAGSIGKFDITGLGYKHAPGLFEFAAALIDVVIMYVVVWSALAHRRRRARAPIAITMSARDN